MSHTEPFESLVGKEFDFFGVDGKKFKVDDQIWQALEDESDGYRSYLRSILLREDDDGIFFNIPIARVKLEVAPESSEGYWEFDGWRLVDVLDDHVWLVMGTNNTDDYYPCFTFDYYPKGEENERG